MQYKYQNKYNYNPGSQLRSIAAITADKRRVQIVNIPKKGEKEKKAVNTKI